MAAILKNNGFLVKVYDTDFQKRIIKFKTLKYNQKFNSIFKNNIRNSKIWNEIKKNIRIESPDVVLINFYTFQYESAIKIAKIIKKINKKILVIASGMHPTIVPEDTIKIPYFDIVIKGEGDYTILDIVKTLMNNKSLKSVKGIYFRKGKRIVKTLTRPLIKDLDKLPIPARNSLLNEKNYPPQLMGSIITSRGCSHRCTFCSRDPQWGSQLRFRNPENIVNEIEEVFNQYRTRQFMFWDSNFTTDRNRVIKICNLIKKKKLRIAWACRARVNNLDEKLIKIMKSSGCYCICLGIESGNQEILNKMKKGITLNQIRKIIKLCKKEGIFVHTWFMLGYPGENKKTIEDTLNFIKELNSDNLVLYFTTPYPTTELYKNLNSKSFLTKNFYDYTGFVPIIKLESLSQEDLWNYYEKINQIENSTKRRIKRIIKKIQSPLFIPLIKEKIETIIYA
jgi:radical SAM superfamily enzyme YgiQ (UPF0313 family)